MVGKAAVQCVGINNENFIERAERERSCMNAILVQQDSLQDDVPQKQLPRLLFRCENFTAYLCWERPLGFWKQPRAWVHQKSSGEKRIDELIMDFPLLRKTFRTVSYIRGNRQGNDCERGAAFAYPY